MIPETLLLIIRLFRELLVFSFILSTFHSETHTGTIEREYGLLYVYSFFMGFKNERTRLALSFEDLLFPLMLLQSNKIKEKQM